MTHLEGRREVHRRDLLLHSSDDAVAAMAGIAAPQAAGAIEFRDHRPRCKDMPFADASRRGFDLNCRLAENGIQNAPIVSGDEIASFA